MNPLKKLLILMLCMAPLLLMAQPKCKIGSSISDSKKILGSAKSENYQNTVTLLVPDTLYGLANEWGYRFTNDTLNWIFFHKYINELSQENFDKCLHATDKLINDFTNEYGKPDSVIYGDTVFKDPYKQHHYGYEVKKAQWENADGMKVEIEFTFFGGKGEYHLIVSIDMFDKSYPYFH